MKAVVSWLIIVLTVGIIVACVAIPYFLIENFSASEKAELLADLKIGAAAICTLIGSIIFMLAFAVALRALKHEDSSLSAAAAMSRAAATLVRGQRTRWTQPRYPVDYYPTLPLPQQHQAMLPRPEEYDQAPWG